jgi:prepilin peptidase CpaA
MNLTVGIWLVLGACAIAVATDLRSRRIPNWLTAALAVAALGFHAASGGIAGLGIAVATLLAVLFIGFVAFSFKWLGGGDVKLLAAGAAALGFPDAVPFLVYTAVGGGLLAIVFALATGRFMTVMKSVTLLLRPFAYKGTTPVAPVNPIMLPYACAIAFGAVAVALSHTAAPFLRLPL